MWDNIKATIFNFFFCGRERNSHKRAVLLTTGGSPGQTVINFQNLNCISMVCPAY